MYKTILIALLSIHSWAWCKPYQVMHSHAPPLIYYNDGHTPSGISVDLLVKIMAQLNLEFNYQYYPVKRYQKLFSRGKAEITINVSVAAATEHYHRTQNSVFSIELGIWWLKGTKPITKFEELKNKGIIKRLGYLFPGIIEQTTFKKYNIKFQEPKSSYAALQMLYTKRGDYLLEYRQLLAPLNEEFDLPKLNNLPLTKINLYFFINKNIENSLNMIKTVDEILLELKHQHFVSKLFEKYSR